MPAPEGKPRRMHGTVLPTRDSVKDAAGPGASICMPSLWGFRGGDRIHDVR